MRTPKPPQKRTTFMRSDLVVSLRQLPFDTALT